MTVAYPVGQFHHPPGGGQDQCEAGVGRGFGQHIGGVGKHDTASIKVGDVIVVHAHRDTGNDLELGRQVKQAGIQAHTGAQQPVGARQRITQARHAIGTGQVDGGDLCRGLKASK